MNNILLIFVVILMAGWLMTFVCFNILSIYAVIKNYEEVREKLIDLMMENPDVNVFVLAMPIVHESTQIEYNNLIDKIFNPFKKESVKRKVSLFFLGEPLSTNIFIFISITLLLRNTEIFLANLSSDITH